MNKWLQILLVLVINIICSNLLDAQAPVDTLREGFRNPPSHTKSWVYWYWISDHISKDGITNDLEAMAKVGIGEAFIGNIDDEALELEFQLAGGTRKKANPSMLMFE